MYEDDNKLDFHLALKTLIDAMHIYIQFDVDPFVTAPMHTRHTIEYI